MSSARKLLWVGLAAVAVAVFAVAAFSGGGSTSVGQRTRSLAGELRCVDCEGLSVAESSTASARLTRRDIETRLRRGESVDEIRQHYVDLNGESILLKPASRGVGVVVWALPIVLLVMGAGLLAVALRRWQRQTRMVPTEADAAFVAEHRAQVDGGDDR